MKASIAKQSAAQLRFQEAVTEQGYKYEVVRSIYQFMALINDYLK